MGGASRNERKRRQEAAQQRLAAAGIRPSRPSGPNRTALVVVAAVVAVAVAIGVTLLVVRGGGDDGAGDVAVTAPAAREGAVVTIGTGPVVVDVYGDYLCPFCERAEERYGDELAAAVNAGRVTVRYHLLAILDRLTDPPGYSTRAADAALCAVDAGIFPAYHARLYAEQPAEGGEGLSDEQLAAFGTELGAPAAFGACVTGTTHDADVAAATERASADPALRGPQGFGTPVYTVGGQRVDVNDPDWLRSAIGG
jgi:protein-disulfide isomerase